MYWAHWETELEREHGMSGEGERVTALRHRSPWKKASTADMHTKHTQPTRGSCLVFGYIHPSIDNNAQVPYSNTAALACDLPSQWHGVWPSSQKAD